MDTIDTQLAPILDRLEADEQTVLAHFFTSTTSDVYAVKDAMPMSLWGFVAGLASRTHLSVRERFLNVFREALSPEEYVDFISGAADSLRSTQAFDLTKVLDKASGFLKKFAVVYGHNSLKDSCVDRIVVDRVSIRAAKILEESSLGAFQEKSTRYMDFSKTTHINPKMETSQCELEWALEMNEDNARKVFSDIQEQSRNIYNTMTARCYEHFLAGLDVKDFANTAAMERTAKAKAFDSARYCLLNSNPTALAFTMPSRETERHLAELLAHPNLEVRAIAKQALDAAKQINPGLLTHVNPNNFQHNYPDYSDLVPEPTFFTPDTKALWYGQRIGVVSYPPSQVFDSPNKPNVWYCGPDDLLAQLASACLCASKVFARSYSDLYTALKQDVSRCLDIVHRRLVHRRAHDELPKEFAVGQLAFNCLLDYGAYRDIQRHRKGLMLCSELDARYGFAIPGVLYEPGFEDLLETYRNYMVEVARVHEVIRVISPQASEYVFALGHNVMFTYICDFKQFIYLVELRSKVHGHMAYRRLAVGMFDAVMASPAFKDIYATEQERFNMLFRIDRTEASDRRQEENKKATQEQ